MKLIKTKVNFEDARGQIRDLLTGTIVDTVTMITCTKGAVRGNHYHKETEQYDYVVSGSMICASQLPGGKVEQVTLVAGDLAHHPCGEVHAFKALEETVFLSLTKGPRSGVDFEKDTYRLDEPILT